ncbi:MAG: undecaprenyl-diphosphate phosphatase [Phycisphaerales bacterium]
MLDPELTVQAAMQVWQAAVLGLVEGVTEYLPVSSTGHLILTSSLLGLNEPEHVKRAVDDFNIVVQGGAILAVLGLYWPRVWQMLKGLVGRDRAGLRLAINIIVAFLPAAVLGVLLNDWIEAKLFNPASVLTALALGGVFMIALDRFKIGPMRRADARAEAGEDVPEDERGHEIDDLTPIKALVVGFMQCVAMWPGTSRSMMTIVGGVLVGLRPKAAAEFSFLLGLPTLGGACLYSLAKNLKESHETGTPNMIEVIGVVPIAVGLVVATVSAAIAVRWLVGFLNRHGLSVFGWYRLVLCAVLGGLLAAGVVTFG